VVISLQIQLGYMFSNFYVQHMP